MRHGDVDREIDSNTLPSHTEVRVYALKEMKHLIE